MCKIQVGRWSRAMIIGVIIAACFACPAAAKYKVLYSFCSQANCSDGGAPIVGLTGDGKGNFFGVTDSGGTSEAGAGTIFKLQKAGKSYNYQVLHTIDCTNSCTEGKHASGELVLDTAGNLYGMMNGGGANSNGLVFELTAGGQYHVLHNFCGGGCSDGAGPSSQLSYVGANANVLYDGAALLYGAAKFGGVNSSGTAFSVTPDGAVQTLYSFCAPSKCKSGGVPQGAVAISGTGTLYGANFLDAGEQSGGDLWSVGPADVLHHFCGSSPCKDGARPSSGVFLDPDSPTLFGTTEMGGAGNYGVAYRLSASGKPYEILHTFCKSGQPCKDGLTPSSTLYPDGAGGVLGVASGGGNVSQTGTLYRIDLATKKLRVLYSFCRQGLCADGANPLGRVVQYGGSIFGVTLSGGSSSSSSGVIYQETP
jgi:uncharacterized repeat protein (TIGR03803 family)